MFTCCDKQTLCHTQSSGMQCVVPISTQQGFHGGALNRPELNRSSLSWKKVLALIELANSDDRVMSEDGS